LGLLRFELDEHGENVENIQQFCRVLWEPMVGLNLAER
jgi:hypothetical protein